MRKANANPPPVTAADPLPQVLPSDPLVTYGTGGTKSPTGYRILTLPEFYHLLRTKHRAKTEALHEPWHPSTSKPKQTRWRQHQQIETTFPFVIAGAVYDAEANAADEEDDWSGWQRRSGLVVVSFKYTVAKETEVVTLNYRLQLQQDIQYVPLLGPSVVKIFKEPGECLLHALIAADPRKDYWGQVNLIMSYLKAIRPKLASQLWGGDVASTHRHSVGYDPHAYLRPRPAEGYPVFPVREALAKIAAGERPNKFSKGA